MKDFTRVSNSGSIYGSLNAGLLSSVYHAAVVVPRSTCEVLDDVSTAYCWYKCPTHRLDGTSGFLSNVRDRRKRKDGKHLA